MGKPEAAVENYFHQLAQDNDFLCYKFRALGIAGVPDRILIGHGLIAFVELKAPKEHVRPLQRLRIAQMRAHGAPTLVIDTRDQVKLFYDAVLGAVAQEPESFRQTCYQTWQKKSKTHCSFRTYTTHHHREEDQMATVLNDHDFNDWYIYQRILPLIHK